MKIYPALDLMQGECVRLIRGKFSQKTVYSRSPLDVIQYFEKQGFKYLHLVDLDGAKIGVLQQKALIKKILKYSSLKIQIGGGIRNKKTIDWLLHAGADRVVIGSLAVTDSKQVCNWLQKYGVEKIVLALDVFIMANNIPQIVIEGWQKVANHNLWQLLDFYQQHFNIHLLCTDIGRDGLLSGPNFALYEECDKRYPSLKFLVSGGVSSLGDIKKLAKHQNIAGVIVGKAIYENKFSLKEMLNGS